MKEERYSDEFSHAAGKERAEESPADNANLIANWMDTLLQLGLGESVLRVGTNLLSILLIAGVLLLFRHFYRYMPETPVGGGVQDVMAAAPTPTPSVSMPSLETASLWQEGGIPRFALLHTTIPTRPRKEVTTYVVQPGDTVFGIAEKFGLQPQTILWANYNTLLDDPHSLKPGQELNILPVDGAYYEWQEGDGLNGVAKFYGVSAEDIVNFEGNHLDPETIGDYAHPNIKPGTWLVIPGGKREFVSWSAPVGVTRENPAVANVLGPGACGPVSGGAIGFGTFVYPTDRHYLSGYDYSPETNHRGIDLAGMMGDNIYATDAGVIVYAGWNNYGYGNMIMIDHGNGFQSLYAHLSQIYVTCGQSVGQGDVIGAMGSTGHSSGPHLHFELMTSRYGKVNPWDFLPPP